MSITKKIILSATFTAALSLNGITQAYSHDEYPDSTPFASIASQLHVRFHSHGYQEKPAELENFGTFLRALQKLRDEGDFHTKRRIVRLI